jgi:hypothetical protein
LQLSIVCFEKTNGAQFFLGIIGLLLNFLNFKVIEMPRPGWSGVFELLGWNEVEAQSE